MTSTASWLCSCLDRLTAAADIPLPTPDGWHPVLALAAAEGLAPAVAFSLERQHVLDVPRPLAAHLAGRFRDALARHVVMSRDLAGLLRRFADERIPAIVLKGAFLAETVYPHPALRPLSDIDVLVRTEDRLRVDGALRDHGYRRGEDAHSWAFDVAYDSATFYDGPGGARVDIHWRLLNDPRYAWDDRQAEAVWERAVAVTLGGEPALGLCPEDLVLSLAAHLAVHHGLSGLVWYWDVALVLNRWSTSIDRETLVTRAGQWRVRRALFSVLLRLRELFAVPDEVAWILTRLEPRGPRAAALQWLVAHRTGQLRGLEHLIALLLVDRAADLGRALGPAIWPTPSWVRARYAAETTSVAQAYRAHYGRMAMVLGRMGQGVLRRSGGPLSAS